MSNKVYIPWTVFNYFTSSMFHRSDRIFIFHISSDSSDAQWYFILVMNFKHKDLQSYN